MNPPILISIILTLGTIPLFSVPSSLILMACLPGFPNTKIIIWSTEEYKLTSL